jgi:hypothetical protein
MIVRLALFEGRIHDGCDRDFRQFVSEKLLPLWRRFPGVQDVRVLHELERDDDAAPVPLALSMAFADRQALARALDSDVRRTSREVTQVLLAMFEGRVRHHIYDSEPLRSKDD